MPDDNVSKKGPLDRPGVDWFEILMVIGLGIAALVYFAEDIGQAAGKAAAAYYEALNR
jgi:hypothetical protein